MLLLQSYKKKCTAQKSSASFLSYIRQAISKFNGISSYQVFINDHR